MQAAERIVFVSGPPGAGKSTISRLLQQRTGGSVLAGDDYMAIVPLDQGEYFTDFRLDIVVNALVDDAVRLARHHPCIVVDFVMLRDQEIQALRRVATVIALDLVLLLPDPKSCLCRDQLRSKDERMGERSAQLAQAFLERAHLFAEFAPIVPNWRRSPSEIVDEIIAEQKRRRRHDR